MINTRQLRAKALETAMKNPRLAQLIVAAVKSPMGSSIRSQAKNVIDSLHTTQLNHVQSTIMPTVLTMPAGGKGGTKNQPMPAILPPPTHPKTISLRPATLKPYAFKRPVPPPAYIPQEQVSSPAQPQFSGVGGYRGKGGSLPGNTSYKQGGRLSETIGNIGSGLQTGGNWLTNLWNQGVSGTGRAGNAALNFLGFTVPKTIGKAALTIPASLAAGAQYLAGGDIPGTTRATSLNDTAGSKLLGEMWGSKPPSVPYDAAPGYSSPASQYPNLKTPIAQAATTPTPIPNFPNINASMGDTLTNQGIVDSSGNVVAAAGSTDAPTNNGSNYGMDTTGPMQGPPAPGETGSPGTFDASGNWIPTGDAINDSLMQAYGKGLGANRYALGVMADSAKMQEFYKQYSPNTPVDKIPVGASLSGQLTNLQDVLYKQYDLDNLHNSLTKAVAAGQALPETAQAYIRGKDEFLNSLDQMQKKATDSFLSSSMGADPFYQTQMKNYLGYLSVLKGNTTQRYIDYLNTGINYQNNQIQNLTAEYNQAADIVNRKYTNQAAITTEDYNNLKQTLVDMYTNVGQREQAQAAKTANEIQLNTNYYNMLKAAADAQKAQKIGGGKPLSSTELQTLDSEVINNPDIISALNSPSLGAYDSDTIFERYGKARAKKIKDDVASSGSLSSLWNQDKNNLALLVGQKDNLNVSDLPTLTDEYVNGLNGAYSEGIGQYLKNHKDQVYSAVKSMSGNYKDFNAWKDYNPWFSGPNADYLKGDKAISEDMARLLFNAVQAQQKAGKAIDENNFSIDDISGAILGQLN